MNVWVSEIKCLLCGHVAGYSVARGIGGMTWPTAIVGRPGIGRQRCPRCGGALYLDPAHQPPRDLGIDESKLMPERQREREEADLRPDIIPDRCCVSCGCPVQRAVRCRRCYLRHRYATNPAVRAKQLALQAQWRKRQAAMRHSAHAAAPN